MSSKHLAIYPGPLQHPEGRDIESLCGEWIRSVIVVAFSDVHIMGKDWREAFKGCCPACLRAAETLSDERPQDVKYIYAIVSRDSKLGARLERAGDQSA